MSVETFLTRVRGIERTANAPSSPVGGYFRYGVITAFDPELWQATIQIGTQIYTGVACSQQIREDLLTVGRSVCVMLSIIGTSQDALVIHTFGGRPPMDPAMDNVRGHKHRLGVAGDGAPISSEDIV